MTTLYTLPNCGICHMIKTKLDQKGIPYEEKDFESFAKKLGTDHAPVLQINIKEGEVYMYSPSEMVQWINSWEG